MSCIPDLRKTEEMYDVYRDGFSLAEVGKMFGVSRQSVYGRFKRRGYELRTSRRLPFLYWRGGKYTVRVNGYYARTNGRRRYLHREVWEEKNGKIPYSHDVHHKDRNKENNDIENLELLSKSEHARRFSNFPNEYTYRKKGEAE